MPRTPGSPEIGEVPFKDVGPTEVTSLTGARLDYGPYVQVIQQALAMGDGKGIGLTVPTQVAKVVVSRFKAVQKSCHAITKIKTRVGPFDANGLAVAEGDTRVVVTAKPEDV